MNGVFYIGATGLQAQQRALDVVAHNISNLNTPTFKRSQAAFAQLVGPADPSVSAGEALGGVTALRAQTVMTQGDLRQTGDPTHLAIDGEGFVELLGAGGRTYLWRGGVLGVDEEGRLTGGGLPLKSQVSVPIEASHVEIGADGVVRAAIGDVREEIGKLELVRVKDVHALKTADGGLFELADEADAFVVEPGEEGGRFVQRALESSNVELASEMISLLLMQRAFAASAQIVQAGDQLMGIVNGLKR